MIFTKYLMEPRVKLIAGWPGCQWNIGTVFPENFIGKDKDQVDLYLHLFKRLEWWEERKPEDMPQYLRMIKGSEYFKPGVYHVKEYMAINGWQDVHSGFLSDDNNSLGSTGWFSPATREEYIAFLNQNKATV